MTYYEKTRLLHIQAVLKKWVFGPPRNKYTFAQREIDKKILKQIELKLAS